MENSVRTAQTKVNTSSVRITKNYLTWNTLRAITISKWKFSVTLFQQQDELFYFNPSWQNRVVAWWHSVREYSKVYSRIAVRKLIVFYRQLMGEELSGLDVTDLQGLENRLEMSLRSIKTRKVIPCVLHYLQFSFPLCFNLTMQGTSTKQDHLMRSEIEELHRKVCL